MGDIIIQSLALATAVVLLAKAVVELVTVALAKRPSKRRGRKR